MTRPSTDEPSFRSSRGWDAVRIAKWAAGGIALALVTWVLLNYDLLSPLYEWFRTDFRGWLNAHPVVGPLAFVLVYISAVVAMVPGSVLTLIAGGVFGPIWGLVFVSAASTVAAGLAFLIARYIAADWVERKASGKLGKLKSGIESEGWRFVAFTRLVPIFPYNLLNYMFGLTRIPFWTYFGVTWICMLPGTFAYVYAGYAGRKVVFGEGGWGYYLTYVGSAVGILILASMIPRWVRKARDQSLEDVMEEE